MGKEKDILYACVLKNKRERERERERERKLILVDNYNMKHSTHSLTTSKNVLFDNYKDAKTWRPCNQSH